MLTDSVSNGRIAHYTSPPRLALFWHLRHDDVLPRLHLEQPSLCHSCCWLHESMNLGWRFTLLWYVDDTWLKLRGHLQHYLTLSWRFVDTCVYIYIYIYIYARVYLRIYMYVFVHMLMLATLYESCMHENVYIWITISPPLLFYRLFKTTASSSSSSPSYASIPACLLVSLLLFSRLLFSQSPSLPVYLPPCLSLSLSLPLSLPPSLPLSLAGGRRVRGTGKHGLRDPWWGERFGGLLLSQCCLTPQTPSAMFTASYLSVATNIRSHGFKHSVSR